MAGGIWNAQNKIRPGAYINFDNGAIEEIDLRGGGLMTIPLELPYGPEQEVIPVTKTANLAQFGYDLDHPSMLLVREALKRARVVLLYRLNKGEVAQAVIGSDGKLVAPENVKVTQTSDDETEVTWDESENIEGLQIKAKYSGEFGNELSVVSKIYVNDPEKHSIEIYLAGKLVEAQTASTVEDLRESKYVEFSGSGELSEFTVTLSGGSNGEVTVQDYADYFDAIQVYDFGYMALPVDDVAIKNAAVSFIKRLRDEEGLKCQLVLAGVDADHEAVINIKNGVILNDGTKISPAQATAWVAGASATIGRGQSLTQQAYDDAKDVNPRLVSSEIEKGIQWGEFMFTLVRGEARVESDINSLHTFTDEKKNVWAKNEAVRTFDYIANNTREVFEDCYIGKVNNDNEGREAFRGDRIIFFENLQEEGSIQNFDKETVKVAPGEQPDAMLLTVDVEVLNTLTKLYMTVSVQ